MCFYRNNAQVEIATRDIVAYKRYTILANGSMAAPYRGDLTNFGKIIAKGWNPLLRARVLPEIHEGVIHMYTNFKEAQSEANRFSDEAVFMAIIPKGTHYCINDYGHIVAGTIIVDSVLCYSECCENSKIKKFEKKYNIVWD